MKKTLRRSIFLATVAIVFGLGPSGHPRLNAQIVGPYPGPPSPQSQRYVLDDLKMQVRWLENATRTGTRFVTGGDTLLWQHYDGVRVSFGALTRVLMPQQLDFGANDLAELDAGLAIIGEAFANFQDDLNRGRSGQVAFHTLCQVLRDSMRVWGQELNRVSKRLQIGR